MTRAALKIQCDVIGGRDTAKTHYKTLRGQHGFVVAGAHALGPPKNRGNHVQGRINRSRPTSTSTTRNNPIQKVQYCGVMEEIRSCISLNTIAPATPP